MSVIYAFLVGIPVGAIGMLFLVRQFARKRPVQFDKAVAEARA